MGARLSRWIGRLRRERGGATAVEFALLAPVMITLYFGLAEYCQAMMADRKATHVASSIGDLVAQSDQITDSDIDDIFAIGKTMMSPFSPTSLKMRVSSVSVNAQNQAAVDWSRGSGLGELAKGSAVALPENAADPSKPFIDAGQTVIMAEAEYTYDSPVKYFIKSGIKFRQVFYLRPRKSDTISKG